MKSRIKLSALIVGLTIGLGAVADTQLTEMLQRLLAIDIKPGAGFSAKVRVPPGELYDPLVMREHAGAVWLNDDGKVKVDKGSRMASSWRSSRNNGAGHPQEY